MRKRKKKGKQDEHERTAKRYRRAGYARRYVRAALSYALSVGGTKCRP